jgi:hypothetical protein
MKTTEQNADAWKRHEDEQRRRWLELTPLERLRWLDGAKSFVALVEATRTPTEYFVARRRSGEPIVPVDCGPLLPGGR